MSEAATNRASVANTRLHPLSLVLGLLRAAGGMVVAIVLVTGAAISEAPRALFFILPSLLVLIGLMFAMAWLRWSRFKYGLGEDEVVIEGGVLFRFRRAIPFSRVQDVSIDRNLLARILGLAKVRVETGGGAKDEGVLDSVTLDEAERLKIAIRAAKARIAGATPQSSTPETAPSTEPEDEAPDGELIFRMDPQRVITFGVFSFSLAWLVVIGFFLQLFTQFIDFDPFGIEAFLRNSAETAARGAADVIRTSKMAALGIAFLVLIGAIVTGFALGIVQTALANYGFRLTANDDRLMCTRGLLTERQTAAAKARIKLARIDTNPIKRRFGWYLLSFQSLSGASGDGGHLDVAPFARLSEIARILETQPPLDATLPETFRPISKTHLYKSWAGLTLLLIPIGIALYYFPWAALPFVIGIPLLATGSWFSWRIHGYAPGERVLFLRRGVWPRRVWIIPYASIECVSLRRNILQRLIGTATVEIDTPGGSKLIPTRVEDLKLVEARDLVEEITARRPSSAP